MDYAPLKFMIKIFEANYPESLGAVLVHKAPWVFQRIWAIIKGWLDPVVAAKVHFTKSVDDLEAFIPRSQIIKELGGDEDWEYSYVEPVEGENETMKDVQRKRKLEEERERNVADFQAKTFKWIATGSNDNDAVELARERDQLAQRLNESYWALDPFIRARTLYDRQGMIGKTGLIDFYPVQSKAAAAAAASSASALTNGNGEVNSTPSNPGAANASADDVD